MLLGFFLGLVAALSTIIGGLIISSRDHVEPQVLKYFVAVGAGFMLSAAILKILPEVSGALLLVLAGYLLIHFFEQTLTLHFHFGAEEHKEAMIHKGASMSALLGLSIHAFFDGAAITSGFVISQAMGILVFGAIVLHKLPEGFTISSIILASGRTRREAAGGAAIIASSTIVGLVAGGLLASVAIYVLAVSCGAIIYVAASDLIPEVNRETNVKFPLAVLVGVIIFYLTSGLLGILGVK